MIGAMATPPADPSAHRPVADLDGAARAHRRAAALAATVDDATVRAASRLKGWTVGHVLTHLARNADGMRAMVEAAAVGRVGLMYPGGLEQRAADIEAGAGRSPGALAADLVASSEALEAAWATLSDEAWATGKGRGPLGDRALKDVPFVRWREVELHLADLGLDAFGVDDWDEEYVRRELRLQVLGFRARRPMGDPELPAGALALPPARRLAWLVGRLALPELGDPGPWA